jgi:hypothetical protein
MMWRARINGINHTIKKIKKGSFMVYISTECVGLVNSRDEGIHLINRIIYPEKLVASSFKKKSNG